MMLSILRFSPHLFSPSLKSFHSLFKPDTATLGTKRPAGFDVYEDEESDSETDSEAEFDIKYWPEAFLTAVPTSWLGSTMFLIDRQNLDGILSLMQI